MGFFDRKKDKKEELKKVKFEDEKIEPDEEDEEEEDEEFSEILEKEDFAFINLDAIYENNTGSAEMVLKMLEHFNNLEKRNFVFVSFFSDENFPSGIIFKKNEVL